MWLKYKNSWNIQITKTDKKWKNKPNDLISIYKIKSSLKVFLIEIQAQMNLLKHLKEKSCITHTNLFSKWNRKQSFKIHFMSLEYLDTKCRQWCVQREAWANVLHKQTCTFIKKYQYSESSINKTCVSPVRWIHHQKTRLILKYLQIHWCDLRKVSFMCLLQCWA